MPLNLAKKSYSFHVAFAVNHGAFVAPIAFEDSQSQLAYYDIKSSVEAAVLKELFTSKMRPTGVVWFDVRVTKSTSLTLRKKYDYNVTRLN